MDIPVGEALTAVKSGVSFVCALCECYWEGVRANNPSCGKEDCCGPFWGGAFGDYKGPIKYFDDRCFVCGDPKIMGVYHVQGEARRFGICRSHSTMAESSPHSQELLLVTG